MSAATTGLRCTWADNHQSPSPAFSRSSSGPRQPRPARTWVEQCTEQARPLPCTAAKPMSIRIAFAAGGRELRRGRLEHPPRAYVFRASSDGGAPASSAQVGADFGPNEDTVRTEVG